MSKPDVGVYAPEELVGWCRRTLPDDTRAFEALVNQYKSRVFAVAYRMMGDRDEAEDQAQEVFLKIYRGVLDLNDPASLPAWITRVTVNTCLDAIGRSRRRPRITSLDAQADDDGPGVSYADERTLSPEDAAMRAELRRCLERTLAAIEPRERAILILRDIEERPYQEIASTLRLGLSAAKMRVHRARQAFQQMIERICPESWRRGQSLSSE